MILTLGSSISRVYIWNYPTIVLNDDIRTILIGLVVENVKYLWHCLSDKYLIPRSLSSGYWSSHVII